MRVPEQHERRVVVVCVGFFVVEKAVLIRRYKKVLLPESQHNEVCAMVEEERLEELKIEYKEELQVGRKVDLADTENIVKFELLIDCYI